MNFTLAIFLLIAFVGSGAFFLIVSQDLKLERREASSAPSPAAEAADTVEEQLVPSAEG